MDSSATFLVVGGEGDLVADAAGDALRRRGVPARRLLPGELAAAPLTVEPEGAALDGRPVAGVAFLARPGDRFSGDFESADQGFADNEVRALWSALLCLPGLWTLNRGDAATWFSSSEWPLWRRRLGAAGVPLAPLTVGGEPADGDAGWLPYTGGGVGPLPPAGAGPYLAAAYATAPETSTAVWCCGRRLDGPSDPDGRRLARVMERWGQRFYAASFDHRRRLLRLLTFPDIPDPVVAAEAGRRMAEDADAHRRRG